MNYGISVYFTFQFEAIHCCPESVCPLEVPYLAYPHRHIFHVRCEAEVRNDNRDIEFIKAKQEVSSWCGQWENDDIGEMSCEQIAIAILENFPYLTKVTVSEDNENGAIVTRHRWE